MDTSHNTIGALSEMFISRMAAFEEKLEKASPHRSNTVAAIAEDFKAFRTFMLSALTALQKQVDILSTECDNMEMRSRRKMLLLHGVPELKDEDTSRVVVKLAEEHLATSLQSDDIRRAFRMGRSGSKPRPILVKFGSGVIRSKVWQAKTGLKGSGITLSEFLTRRRHEVFLAARERYGMTRCWTRDGQILISDESGKKWRVSSFHELNKISATGGASGSSGPADNHSSSGLASPPVSAATPKVKRKRVAAIKK